MSYFEDVYLKRINLYGNNRQERIVGEKEKFFEAFLKKTIYRASFTINGEVNYGSLQPAKGDEKDIISYLLTKKNIVFPTGTVIEITDLNNVLTRWLVTYRDNNISYGYNRYKVYLLDRVLTWWDNNKISYTAYVNLASSKDKSVTDIFNNISGTRYQEGKNFVNVIMKYSSNIKEEVYCTLDGNSRAFTVTGFDCETVPGVQYVTLNITPTRDETTVTTKPSSFWSD